MRDRRRTLFVSDVSEGGKSALFFILSSFEFVLQRKKKSFEFVVLFCFEFIVLFLDLMLTS